jgi:DNA transformation protein
MKMSYSSAPIEIFDDPEIAKTWATRAYEAALRSRSKTTKRPK